MGNLCGSERGHSENYTSKQLEKIEYKDVTIFIVQGLVEDEKATVILNATDAPYDSIIYKRQGIPADQQLTLSQGQPLLLVLQKGKANSEYMINLQLPNEHNDSQAKRIQAFVDAFKLANDKDLESLSFTDHPSSGSLNQNQEKNAQNFFEGLQRFLEEREKKGLKVVKCINLDLKTVTIYQNQVRDQFNKYLNNQNNQVEEINLQTNPTVNDPQGVSSSPLAQDTTQSTHYKEDEVEKRSASQQIQNMPVILTKIEDKSNQQQLPEGVNIVSMKIEQPQTQSPTKVTQSPQKVETQQQVAVVEPKVVDTIPQAQTEDPKPNQKDLKTENKSIVEESFEVINGAQPKNAKVETQNQSVESKEDLKNKPVEPQTKPVEPQTKPVEPYSKPEEPEAKPVDQFKPVEPQSKQVEPQSKPESKPETKPETKPEVIAVDNQEEKLENSLAEDQQVQKTTSTDQTAEIQNQISDEQVFQEETQNGSNQTQNKKRGKRGKGGK